MKKLFLMALLCVAAISASAQQNITVWYGANVSGVTFDGDSPDSGFKPLNLGVSYTAPLADAFDWSAGLGYVTKGFGKTDGDEDWNPGFIQLEGNASWKFVNQDMVKVGLFTGPYVSFLVNKDDVEELNTVDFGWQAGVQAMYSRVSLKVGYELGFCDLVKHDFESKQWNVFFRLGYSF